MKVRVSNRKLWTVASLLRNDVRAAVDFVRRRSESGDIVQPYEYEVLYMLQDDPAELRRQLTEI